MATKQTKKNSNLRAQPKINPVRSGTIISKEKWIPIKKFKDIRYEKTKDGIAKITINRPEVRNAFRPQTVIEMKEAFELAREDQSIGVVILTGEGPMAFCSERTEFRG